MSLTNLSELHLLFVTKNNVKILKITPSKSKKSNFTIYYIF